jgi:hypothetical protein
MKSIRATVENENNSLQEALTSLADKHDALVAIENCASQSTNLFSSELIESGYASEEEFEIIGLRDFLGNPVEEIIDWEAYFHVK